MKHTNQTREKKLSTKNPKDDKMKETAIESSQIIYMYVCIKKQHTHNAHRKVNANKWGNVGRIETRFIKHDISVRRIVKW